MTNPLVRKLAHAGGLTEVDRAVLRLACTTPRLVEAGRDLVQDGDRPEGTLLILEGFAYRYKILPGGRRQITAVLVPGDTSDLHIGMLDRMDHAIGTFTPCMLVHIPRATIEQFENLHPNISRALKWVTLVDAAILRAWLINVGQREALSQIAQLFCELYARLNAVGLAEHEGAGASFAMPFRQADLADMLGLTSVHINRTLRDLREAGMLALRQRRLRIFDLQRLRAFCDFHPDYLHLATGHEES